MSCIPYFTKLQEIVLIIWSFKLNNNNNNNKTFPAHFVSQVQCRNFWFGMMWLQILKSQDLSLLLNQLLTKSLLLINCATWNMWGERWKALFFSVKLYGNAHALGLSLGYKMTQGTQWVHGGHSIVHNY